jgi:hypothetical protein
MNDNETYLFHQTPNELARDLINIVPLENGDTVLEPFKGQGAFYDALPTWVNKDWAEIKQGRDYKTIQGNFDWVISNPPFKLENEDQTRENAFWKILKFYLGRVNKGIALLGNDYCLCTLTPNRLTEMKKLGFSIQKIVCCNVKKWRGRYFFIIIEKKPENLYSHLTKNY